MAYSPFKVFEDSTAGRVQGYTRLDRTTESVGAYDVLEDIFRGSEKLVRDRRRRHLDLLEGHEPILDLACGRGEFLDLLREQRIEHTGVDSDPGMVEHCRKKGHERVELADANSYLKRCEDESIGVIFCAQLIEHLPYEELLRFYELSERKLKPGGLFIAETVNPHSEAALKTFWANPTHQHPILPEVALALCRSSDFESAYVFYPNGNGDVETDRYESDEYAVVATKMAQKRTSSNRSERIAKKE
jgi:SAM-dependent methyltransferase